MNTTKNMNRRAARTARLQLREALDQARTARTYAAARCCMQTADVAALALEALTPGELAAYRAAQAHMMSLPYATGR